MTANRALENPESIELQHLYRAMDVLLEYREIIHKEVFFAVADLLNPAVDLIFFETTSTYFEMDEEDENGPRHQGSSAGPPPGCYRTGCDERGNPGQVLDMIGNTSDMKTVETVKSDLLGWKLGRCNDHIIFLTNTSMLCHQKVSIKSPLGRLDF